MQPYQPAGQLATSERKEEKKKSKFGLKISKIIGGVLGSGSADGIRSLLHAAATRAIEILGKMDGYFSHHIVKILVPEKLNPLVSLAKKFKLQKYVDKFILSMNRAAESAASLALPIFERFIKALTINDVARIATGGDTAARDYFQSQTERDLKIAYTPVVEESMNRHEVTRQFNELMDKTKSIPGLSKFNVDIHQYTIDKATGGLFWMLGDQEKKLRDDPTGRISSLVDNFLG